MTYSQQLYSQIEWNFLQTKGDVWSVDAFGLGNWTLSTGFWPTFGDVGGPKYLLAIDLRAHAGVEVTRVGFNVYIHHSLTGYLSWSIRLLRLDGIEGGDYDGTAIELDSGVLGGLGERGEFFIDSSVIRQWSKEYVGTHNIQLRLEYIPEEEEEFTPFSVVAARILQEGYAFEEYASRAVTATIFNIDSERGWSG